MMKRTARLSLNHEGKSNSIAKFATMITICLHLSLILVVVIVSARKVSEDSSLMRSNKAATKDILLSARKKVADKE
jgi:hypothetical protein